MSDDHAAVLAAAEGAGADIAWVIVYVMCWILMIAPFALWYAGVRTPRAERRAAREARNAARDGRSTAPASEAVDLDDTPVQTRTEIAS